MNWKYLLGGIIILTVLGGVGYWGYKQFSSPKPEATTETACYSSDGNGHGLQLERE